MPGFSVGRRPNVIDRAPTSADPMMVLAARIEHGDQLGVRFGRSPIGPHIRATPATSLMSNLEDHEKPGLPTKLLDLSGATRFER
jgi:hypothetical protein